MLQRDHAVVAESSKEEGPESSKAMRKDGLNMKRIVCAACCSRAPNASCYLAICLQDAPCMYVLIMSQSVHASSEVDDYPLDPAPIWNFAADAFVIKTIIYTWYTFSRSLDLFVLASRI